jgi:urocanate hydratase
MTASTEPAVRAPRGAARVCKTWAAEAAFRMIQNNLDPEVAEKPSELVVYGGTGKAARNWDCFNAILDALRQLEVDETLLVQSGKPVGIVRTHQDAPRVLIANTNLVPKWATLEKFQELDAKGLMMYGQMTAGSWIYIGTQGILQGTYETLAACGRKYFHCTPLPLSGKVVVSAGLGGMGGAQPLATVLAGATFLGVDVDPARIARRLETRYLDEQADSIPDAVARVRRYATNKEARSVGLVANAGDLLAYLLETEFIPDVLTDQTSAHDPLHGYVPVGLDIHEAHVLRDQNPQEYLRRSMESIGRHVSLMLALQVSGAVTFDYGNNIRAMAEKAGVADAFRIPGFVPEFIRPIFCEGGGPFRWVALSGDPRDILETDQAMLGLFPDNTLLANWLQNGAPRVAFQGLPARICWLRYGEREEAGVRLNQLVREGRVSAPIVIGRDHLDAGSVASPYRETERMKDGSDAVADWVFLNAMINAVNGASWVSIHQGGGVGIGYSQHAGMVVVADGTEDAERRLRRVLNSDPATGVLRHADAQYLEAVRFAHRSGLKMPMLKQSTE